MREHYTLIKNARVVKMKERRLYDLDILVRHGQNGEENTIAALDRVIDRKSLSDCTLSVINAHSQLVLPSFTDLSVCLREPGSMYKEDIASTCKAAMAGGYHALLSYFEPDIRFTAEDVLLYTAAARKSPSVSIYSAVYAGEGDWDKLFAAGAFCVTDRFAPFEKASELRDAMKRAKEKDVTFFAFPQIASLSEGGSVNLGMASMMKQKPLPPSSEEIAVARLLLLSEETGCRLHLSGVSTARSFGFIREAKKAGVDVTCDVSPFHFFFDEGAILFYGNTAKLMPPLRSEADRLATVEAIADGTVDAIASHHLPNDKLDVERPLAMAPFGAVSLETVFSACVEKLLSHRNIDIFRLCELLSTAPHAILSRAVKGYDRPLCDFTVGAPADFNLVSLDRHLAVEADALKGRAKNTPFLGMVLRGRVEKSFFSVT